MRKLILMMASIGLMATAALANNPTGQNWHDNWSRAMRLSYALRNHTY
jgi:hypothetical protein